MLIAGGGRLGQKERRDAMYADVVAYMQKNTADYAMSVLQHIRISALSVALALLIAVPLGFLGSRNKKLNRVFNEGFGLLRIVPSLAILVICIPLIGVGVLPAIAALTILAIPPILINTAVGFSSVSESVIETAVGMGMHPGMILTQIELPLAFPLILTGIRTAAVEVIASATLAAYIGGGGLGTIIFTGLGLYRMDLLVIGGFSVAALSLLADLLFHAVERLTTRYQRI